LLRLTPATMFNTHTHALLNLVNEALIARQLIA
jgi:hypothetical protein